MLSEEEEAEELLRTQFEKKLMSHGVSEKLPDIFVKHF
jgi:hypothetical protein